MDRPIASVIIPTHDHAHCLRHAIESCLAQTIGDVEVIVVDDGSTDSTAEDLHFWDGDPRVRVYRQDHLGPVVARNAGLALATGEWVMFLDADDTLESPKIASQLRELKYSPEADWCLCDVRIIDAAMGRTVLASDRYDYAHKLVEGWIFPLLRNGNFIPIMSPLVRRSVLEEHRIRFEERFVPEDYHFWCKVAKIARVRYIPEILATYNKSRLGRSRTPPMWRKLNPHVRSPLRLNLGCGTQGKESWHPIQGFVNLDKSMGWTYESGLGDFADDSVSGITISHSLMFVALKDWPFVLRECLRALRPGGVLRITEDEAMKQESKRYGGWKGSEPFVTLTGDERLWLALACTGFDAFMVNPLETHYEDGSLVQQLHGDPPDVFFIEGVKRA